MSLPFQVQLQLELTMAFAKLGITMASDPPLKCLENLFKYVLYIKFKFPKDKIQCPALIYQLNQAFSPTENDIYILNQPVIFHSLRFDLI